MKTAEILLEFQKTLRHANLGHSTLGGTVPADGVLSRRQAKDALAQMDRAISECAEQGLAEGPHAARFRGHVEKLKALRSQFAEEVGG